MNVFNSLGSNYTWSTAWNALFSKNKKIDAEKLRQYLDSKYGGQTILTYKGREALEMAFNILDLPLGTKIAINGYTCYAVYQAVTNAGHKPVLLDIAPGTLNFGAKQLLDAINNDANIKVIVVQNTLGYPVDIKGIATICREKNIFLIEDLAHSVGTTYHNDQKAGRVGDFVMLSFGQDKIIDAISGGALVIRNKFQQNKTLPVLLRVASKQQIRDRFYPLFTLLIRSTYNFGFGKILHSILRSINFLPTPVSEQAAGNIHELPYWQCRLALRRLETIDQNFEHRREIANVYLKALNSSTLLPSVILDVDKSTNLRFPIFAPPRDKIILALRQRGIHVSDIWYDAPVAPARMMPLVTYNGDCHEAEKIANLMINLPTHQAISRRQAKAIAVIINTCLNQ